jgi:hypothetical protein
VAGIIPTRFSVTYAITSFFDGKFIIPIQTSGKYSMDPHRLFFNNLSAQIFVISFYIYFFLKKKHTGNFRGGSLGSSNFENSF